MSYPHPDRVELYGLKGGIATDVVQHQNRGDGTALCAVGTQYPNSEEWRNIGPGEVTCELCGASNTPEGRASAKRTKRVPDPRMAESLDERIARMKAKKEENA